MYTKLTHIRQEPRLAQARPVREAEHVRPRRRHDVLLPGYRRAAVGAEEVARVLRVVLEAELVVVHVEALGREVPVVRLAAALHIAGAPATVDQLPLAAVDAHRVPRVPAVERRHGRAMPQRRVAESFAVAADDDAFEADGRGEGGEEAGVAFADRQAGGYGGRGRAGLDVVAEKGSCVVVNIVVKPCEESAGLVGEGRERISELVRQPAEIMRRNCFTGKTDGMRVYGTEIAAFQARILSSGFRLAGLESSEVRTRTERDWRRRAGGLLTRSTCWQGRRLFRTLVQTPFKSRAPGFALHSCYILGCNRAGWKTGSGGKGRRLWLCGGRLRARGPVLVLRAHRIMFHQVSILLLLCPLRGKRRQLRGIEWRGLDAVGRNFAVCSA